MNFTTAQLRGEESRSILHTQALGLRLSCHHAPEINVSEGVAKQGRDPKVRSDKKGELQLASDGIAGVRVSMAEI